MGRMSYEEACDACGEGEDEGTGYAIPNQELHGDIRPHHRYFAIKITERNGSYEYIDKTVVTVPAYASKARVLLEIQIDARQSMGADTDKPAPTDEELMAYAKTLSWEDEVADSELWYDDTVCLPVEVLREITAEQHQVFLGVVG